MLNTQFTPFSLILIGEEDQNFCLERCLCFMSIIMALAGSALTVGSFWTLITNVSGACSSVLGLVSSIGFVVCSVVAAKGWHGMFVKKG